MRSIFAIAVVAALSCRSGAPAPSGVAVNFRILQNGTSARYDGSMHQTTYATTPEAYAQAWSSIVGGGEPPQIDFTREAALFVATGQRPTGGWRVGFAGVRKEGDALIIDAPVTGPGPDTIVTQALTSPYVVVAVEKASVDRVIWRNAPDAGASGAVTQ
jgi:hypothetical protein